MLQTKTFLFAGILASILFSVKSQTFVESGDISGTWIEAGSPYIINGDLTIPNNETLTIEPGVVIQFFDNYKIFVNGKIRAIGSISDTVKFTVSDTTGYSTNEHKGWGGLRFQEEADSEEKSEFSYCLLEYGKAVGTDYNFKYGGAINTYNNSNLIFRNCLFQYNYARTGGGAIYLDNNLEDILAVVIDSCSFYKNTTGSNGVYSWGGAILSDGKTYITHSKFIENRSGVGGAISNQTSANTEIISSFFDNNTTTIQGGALHNDGTMIIFNSLLYSNGTRNLGGALYSTENSKTTILQTSIIDNYVLEYGDGAGIFNGGEMFMANTLLVANVKGDGLNFTPTVDFVNARKLYSRGYNIISNVGNHILDRGAGDLFGTERYPIVNLQSFGYGPSTSSYAMNNAKGDNSPYLLPAFDINGYPRIYGGTADIGALENQSDVTIGESINVYPDSLSFNMVTINQGKTFEATITNGNHSDLAINAINAPSNITMMLRGSDQSFSQTISGFTLPAQKDTTLLIQFNPNSANEFAGTINISSNALDYSSIDIKISGKGSEHTTFEGTIASDITWNYDTLLITGDVKIEKSAKLTITPGTVIAFTGHYMLEVEGILDAQGTENNQIKFLPYSDIGWHGLRFVDNDSDSKTDTSKLKFCLFKDGYATADHNSSDILGGAVFISNYDKLEITYNLFEENHSVGSGGAIFMEYSDANIEYNSFYKNQSGYYGGAIASYYCTGTISNNMVLVNSTEIDGGGIYLFYDRSYFSNNYIANNESGRHGGGLYIASNNYSPTKVLNNIFSNNEAGGNGGGIFSYRGEAFFENNTIVNNNSQGSGGGYFNLPGATYPDTIINSILWGNTDTTGINDVFGMPVINYSDLSVDFPGEFNINQNPQFKKPSEGSGKLFSSTALDWELLPTSPCINKGKYINSTGPLPLFNLNGTPRINCYNDTIDMGAFEYFTGIEYPVLLTDTISVNENINIGFTTPELETEKTIAASLINNSDIVIHYNPENTNFEVIDSTFFNHEQTQQQWFSLIFENNCEAVTDSFLLLIKDVNEKPLFGQYQFEIPDTLSAGSILDTLAASDEDFGETLTYTIVSGNAEELFILNSENGELSFAKDASEAESHEYQLITSVTDKGGLSDTVTIFISIQEPTLINIAKKEKPYTLSVDPFTSSINLEWLGQPESNSSIWLMDITGKIIQTEKITYNHFVIDTQGLKSGIYIIKIANKRENYIEKLIIKNH